MNDKELARQLYSDKNKIPTEQDKNEFVRLVKAGIIVPYEFYSAGRFIHDYYVKLMETSSNVGKKQLSKHSFVMVTRKNTTVCGNIIVSQVF